jgi:adenylate cyclase
LNLMEDRRHIAVMFTDIVGYTALMGSDEDKAFDLLKRNHTIHESLIEKYNGTLVKEVGDGTLASFPLASDAVRCAMDIQKEAKSQEIPLKIGIHQGEMVFVGSDVLGDGVNVASRLQESAEEGFIYISGAVYRDVKNKTGISTEYVEEKTFKNVDEPIKVYTVYCEEQEQPAPSTLHPAPVKPKRSYYYIGLFLILIVAALIWFFYPRQQPKVEGTELDKSIAVLPFKNLSEDQSNQHFCDGVMEGILNHLSKIKDLRVASRTSVEQFREEIPQVQDIAEQLNVTYLLEASVFKSEDKIRVTTQLINAITDEHLWSDQYDRELEDVFDVMSEISKEVASEVKVVIAPEVKDRIESVPTENLEAYEHYLQGNEYLWEDGKEDSAVFHFKESIALDPEFAEAYLKLGEAYHSKTYWSEYFQDTFADSLIIYADKALRINPFLADGYALKGYYYYVKSDFKKSLEQYEKAIEINPLKGIYYKNIGDNYHALGNYKATFTSYEKARRLLIGDPDYKSIISAIAMAYIYIGDFDKAITIAEKTSDKDSSLVDYYKFGKHFLVGEWDMMEHYVKKRCANDSGFSCIQGLAWLNLYLENFHVALKYFEKLGKIAEESIVPLLFSEHRYAYVLYNVGKKEEAMKHFELQIEYGKERIRLKRYDATVTCNAQSDLVHSYAFLGEKQKAYDILHEMEGKEFLYWHFSHYKYTPFLKNLWEDEEFKQIIQRQEKKYAEIRAEIDRLEQEGLL